MRSADRLVWLAFAGDLLIIAGAAIGAFWLRFESPLLSASAAPIDWHEYANFIALSCISLLAAIASLGIYDRHLLLRFTESARRVSKAWAYWLGAVLIFSTLVNLEPSISRIFLALFSGAAGGGLLLWRWGFHRFCQSERRAGSLRERVLVIGWNADAQRLAATMRGTRGSPYELVGWLPLPSQSASAQSAEVPCLGAYPELMSILRYSRIDIVILTDHDAERDDILEVIRMCEREMVQFELVPSFFRILLKGLHLHSFGGLPLLGVSRLPLNRFENRFIKRAGDLVGGAIGLLVTAPLMAVFGTLVYLESRGPVFFSQERIGRRGVPFKMYKLRSMRPDAAQTDHLQQSTGRGDPRLLRVGALMRRWNIDEVPQFWNVLKGEMSLVGPRPERTYHSGNLSYEIPHYSARNTVKPGITGWAQVHGLRGDTDLTERISHDIFYLDNWTPALDLQIMFLTLFKNSNAC